MANSTSLVLFQRDDPFDAKAKGAIAAFLAGYGGATLRSYTTDLRIFAEWCADNRVAVLEAKRAHIETFGREMESAGKIRSTVARRMSTIAGFFKYCLMKDSSIGTRPRMFDDQKLITNQEHSDWIATSLAGCSSKPVWEPRVNTR